MTVASANQSLMNHNYVASQVAEKERVTVSDARQAADPSTMNDSCRKGLQPCATSGETKEVCKATGGE